jgi:hypothetical protein
MNATRHGLLAKNILLSTDYADTFAALLHQHLDKFQPTDDLQHAAVEEMTVCMWRLRRTWAVETGLLNYCLGKEKEIDPDGPYMLSAAFSTLSRSTELALIDRYENRFHRMYARAFKNFMLLRDMPELPNEPTDLVDNLVDPPIAELPNEPTEEPEIDQPADS